MDEADAYLCICGPYSPFLTSSTCSHESNQFLSMSGSLSNALIVTVKTKALLSLLFRMLEQADPLPLAAHVALLLCCNLLNTVLNLNTLLYALILITCLLAFNVSLDRLHSIVRSLLSLMKHHLLLVIASVKSEKLQSTTIVLPL